ncbi:MAG TPA: nuclear transport factor 2 family protein [Polyangiaceae bacterium]|nr:nuclear transport factor 2 family protein [Polyangiaceae bacterium]
MSNIDTVKEVYAAYARGDMPGILACLAEDVEWENGGGGTDVPWLQPRSGHAGVVGFFEAVGLLQVNDFRPKWYFEREPLVIVLVDEDVTVKATGRRIRELDQVHLWTFDQRGKVVRHRQRVDTHGNWAAYHGCAA